MRNGAEKQARPPPQVAPGLCVGGGAVARSREALRAAGVTHVVNCVGMLIPACFAPDIDYLTLFLQGGLAAAPARRHVSAALLRGRHAWQRRTCNPQDRRRGPLCSRWTSAIIDHSQPDFSC